MSSTTLPPRGMGWLVGISLASLSAAALSQAAFAQAAKPIDDARLAAAGGDADNWLTFGHDYTNQRFSALKQVDRTNVAKLAPAWIYQFGTDASTQMQPLVADGVMYFPAPNDDIVAVNAATGAEIWRYRHKFSTPRAAPGSRGIAIGYGMVFEGTDDKRVIAVDQATGKLLWDHEVKGFDPTSVAGLIQGGRKSGPVNFSFRYPAEVYDGMVIVSTTLNSGPIADVADFIKNEKDGVDIGTDYLQANLGVRGFTVALDAKTGNEVWRFYTSPDRDWEGTYGTVAANGTKLVDRDVVTEKAMATIYTSGWAANGTAVAWAPAIDPALGLLYVPTGNPGIPFDLLRPGDNLYSNSIVALDTKTGKLKWYMQTVPHGGDYDLISQTMLFDTTVNGQRVAAVGDGGKDGFYYAVDRATGKLLFASPPLVPTSNTYRYPTKEGMLHEPGEPGGASVSPHSYDASTGIAYIAEIHRPTVYTKVDVPAFLGPSDPRLNPYADPVFFVVELSYAKLATVALDQAYGLLTAIDLKNGGKIVWQTKVKEPLVGGVLATAGGIVFAGEANGHFNAYDAKTGTILWSFQTGGNVGASAVSYSVNGKQYVAVATGVAAPLDGTPLAAGALGPGGMIVAFALPQ
jgi:alcohol dehydrogenase (cytochrome c)